MLGEKFKIAVGGHACRANRDADLFLDKHSDHLMSGNEGLATRTLLEPAEEQIIAALQEIPTGAEVSVHTSLQGRYSLETAPRILQHLMGRVRGIELVLEPIPENIRQNVYFAPSIRLSRMTEADIPYDVAISYAGEDIHIAESLAGALKSASFKVFFDRFETSSLWGKDLYQHLHEIYSRQARFCIVLISRNYVAEQKKWTRHELKAAQERQLVTLGEYILPLRLDDASLPGLPQTIAYLDFRSSSVDDVVSALREKVVRFYDAS